MAWWYDVFPVYETSLVYWHHFLMFLSALLTISDLMSCFQDRSLLSVGPWVVGVRDAPCDNSSSTFCFALSPIVCDYFLWKSVGVPVAVLSGVR